MQVFRMRCSVDGKTPLKVRNLSRGGAVEPGTCLFVVPDFNKSERDHDNITYAHRGGCIGQLFSM